MWQYHIQSVAYLRWARRFWRCAEESWSACEVLYCFTRHGDRGVWDWGSRHKVNMPTSLIQEFTGGASFSCTQQWDALYYLFLMIPSIFLPSFSPCYHLWWFQPLCWQFTWGSVSDSLKTRSVLIHCRCWGRRPWHEIESSSTRQVLLEWSSQGAQCAWNEFEGFVVISFGN